jgi:adenylate kinase
MLRLLLFGPPGVGKGTQAKLLSEIFSIPHISTGDLLRQAVTGGTDVGLKAKSIMESGHLVPDDVMILIVRDALDSPSVAQGFLLDGFPRTIAQAEALKQIFKERGIIDYRVIEFDADTEEIVRRISSRISCPNDGHIFNSRTDHLSVGFPCPECGTALIQRTDDSEETVRHRLTVYHSRTAPVLEYYEKEGVALHIDATQPIEAVTANIKSLLKEAGVL